jgi:hypothetical protein
MIHHDTDLYDLKIRADGRTTVVDTTSNHPVWDATSRRWVKAAALKYGAHPADPSGNTATVVGGWAPKVTAGWMWDLTIPGDHDFYVVTVAADILVRNCGGLDQFRQEFGLLPSGEGTLARLDVGDNLAHSMESMLMASQLI